MPNFLAEILTQVRSIWSRLDGGQRMVILAVLAATLTGIGAIVWFSSQPDYVAVFSDNDAREVMRAARALDGSVAYRIEGGSVKVDAANLEAARRLLTTGGVLTGGGSEESQLFGMTSDRETRLHALSKAMERDAEAKLERIRGVVQAQVSHSKPKRSPYRQLDPETQPRAHVGLKLSPGVDFLAVAPVAAAEVAAALGMPPSYVTVTNLSTMAHWSPADPESGGLDTSEFLAQQRRRSEDLTQAAQGLLDRIFPDKAVVRVTVDLDPDWRVTKERGAPDKQGLRSTQQTKDDSKEAARAADSNAGNGGSAPEGASLSKTSKTTEYMDGEFRETSSGKLAPDVRRLSVALVLDKNAAQAADKTELTNQIKRAIGWQQGRDDEVTILEAEFPEIALTSEVGHGIVDTALAWAPHAAQVLSVLLVLWFLRRLLRTPAALPGRAGGSGGVTRSSGNGSVTSGDSDEPTTPEEASKRMRREIEKAIAEDPATVSRLLESWLTEQRT